MRRIPPPLWMFLLLAAGYGLSLAYPWARIAQWPVLGAVLIVASGLLGVSAFLLFLMEKTELNPAAESNKKLVTGGPFRITRNPMYLCLELFSLGIAFLVGTAPMFAAPVILFAISNWVHIPFEEANMRRQFGSAFDDYARHVRRWI